MAYQSLYRKYRPQTFADVVGQGHVTRTLQNALESGRIGHGYLFTGTRGTAKTTVARLLAKALNCESADAPVREPCNRCGACLAITGGSAIDVIEMDAASHRGVADIEEVRRSVSFGPMELRYKVFIIDEAHQLSSDAKDAFLKTLEEPPANVVFILATTEPQSIPITIRSRCQQFDFKRGSISDITGRLRYVLDCEGVRYTPEAVAHVARGAEGSYRDSLSLLEQVLAYSPNSVSTADVDTVLGTLDREMLRRVTSAVAERNAPEAFALAGELLDAGKEARTLLRTLSLHFRDLLLVSIGGPAAAQELTPEELGPLQTEAQAFERAEMIRAMEILNEAQGETRWNNQHRLLVELTFLKLMNLGESTPPSGRAPAPVVFQERRPAHVATTPPAVLTAPVAWPGVDSAPSPVLSEKIPISPTPVSAPAVAAAREPLPAASAPPVATHPLAPSLLPVYDDADIADDEPVDTMTGNLFPDDPVVEAVVQPISTESTVAFDLDDVLHCWPDFLRRAGSVSRMTETMMLQSRPSAVRNGVIEISFRNASPFDMMNRPKSQEFVREALKRCLGVERAGVHFVLEEGSVTPPPEPRPKAQRRERDAVAELKSQDEGPTVRLESGQTPARVAVEPSDRAASLASSATPEVSKVAKSWPEPAVNAAESARNGSATPNHQRPDLRDDTARKRNGASRVNPELKDDPLVQEVLSTFGGEIVEE